MRAHVRIRPACRQNDTGDTLWSVDWYDGRGCWQATERGPFSKRKAKARASRARRIIQRDEDLAERRYLARLARELEEENDQEKPAGAGERAAVPPVR